MKGINLTETFFDFLSLPVIYIFCILITIFNNIYKLMGKQFQNNNRGGGNRGGSRGGGGSRGAPRGRGGRPGFDQGPPSFVVPYGTFLHRS